MQITQSEINKLRPFIQIIENYDSTDRTIYLGAMEFTIYRNWRNNFYFHIIFSSEHEISGCFCPSAFILHNFDEDEPHYELEYDYLKLVLSSEENKFQYSINDGIDYNDQIFEFILDIGTNIKYDEVTKE